ncbi:sugar transferase [Actinomadura flavalba]|uniref:sugar transferase n=1 Tax=Actinomadura flavalba TaxID=1120938 RepID=UPI001F0B6983|nr:sugar transferase [Actinomadura flavalba]
MTSQRTDTTTLIDEAVQIGPGTTSGSPGGFGPASGADVLVRPTGRGALALPLLTVALDAANAAVVARLMLGGRLHPAVFGAAALLVALNASAGLYRVRRFPSLLGDVRPLLLRALAVAALFSVLAPVAPGSTVPARWLGGAALFVLAPAATRLVLDRLVRIGRLRGPLRRPLTLVVGTGVLSDYLVWSLRRRPEIGLLPLGRIGTRDPERPGEIPLLGGPYDLRRVIEAHRVDTVVIVLDDIERQFVEPAVRLSVGAGCQTLVVPTSEGIAAGTTGRVRHLAGVPCVPVSGRPYGLVGRTVKRVFDCSVALALLAVLWPVLAACAFAVRRETGPGVIFKQSRIGLDGQPFVLLKFRTLRPADETESDTRWSVHGDDRIGPVGSLLRRTSLDELPQLWNVVRGDMSLVGPRPERPHFVRRFSETCPGYVLRHRVPVGMTGWAQVHGLRGDTSIEMRARFDNHYIDHWSFAADLKILLLTFGAMVLRNSP